MFRLKLTVLIVLIFAIGPVLHGIITSSYSIAIGWLAIVAYTALALIHIDSAILVYLFIASAGLDIPELQELQYQGLILENILLGIVLLAATAKVVTAKGEMVKSPVNLPLFGFFAVYALYSFWSTGPIYPELLESLRNVKRILEFPAVYWIVLNSASVESKRRPCHYLVAFTSISLVGAFHALWRYRQVLNDFTVTFWNDQRINRSETLGETFNMTCVLAMLVLTYYVIQTKGQWLRRALGAVGIGIFAATNMLFLYRAGTTAMLVAVVVFVILLKRIRAGGWLLVLLAAFAIILLWFAPQALERATWTYGVRRDGTVGFDPSFAYRKDYLWPLAFSLIRDNFLWGVGYDNYQRIAGMNVHNQFLSWLVELGIVGFAAGIWFYAKTCLFLWRRFVREHNAWAKAMAVSTLCLMLSMVVAMQTHDSFLYEWLYFPLVFAAVLGRRVWEERSLEYRTQAVWSGARRADVVSVRD